MPSIRPLISGTAAAVMFGLSVAACTPGGAGSGDLDLALSGDLTLLGTEPFWAVEISDTTKSAIFTRPDFAPITAGPPERTPNAEGARFVAGSPDGELVMMLKRRACSDGMSDRIYPYEAELQFGADTFRGCAGKPTA